MQITKLSNDDNSKITETYLQAYYTNELKLKIKFSKVLIVKLSGYCNKNNTSWGNDENIIINVSNPNVLDIRNNINKPVKITIKPR